MISCPEGPELFSAGMGYQSFRPIQIPRSHPPRLAQRERSTSAPNVCFNAVAQSVVGGTLDDWSYDLKPHNLACTGTINSRYCIIFFYVVTWLENLFWKDLFWCSRVVHLAYSWCLLSHYSPFHFSFSFVFGLITRSWWMIDIRCMSYDISFRLNFFFFFVCLFSLVLCCIFFIFILFNVDECWIAICCAADTEAGLISLIRLVQNGGRSKGLNGIREEQHENQPPEPQQQQQSQQHVTGLQSTDFLKQMLKCKHLK